MRYRKLGKTGFEVSEIGFGAWGIGKSEWVGADDAQSLRTLQAARDAGLNFFDTALAYGEGHSESLLARAFGKSKDVVIASKVPPKNMVWPAQDEAPLREVFPSAYVLKSLEKSLKNLRRDTVDIYQFHVWNDRWAEQPEWQETVKKMRDSGKVRGVGLSINDHQPGNSIKALATGLIDTVQVIYNIFDQTPQDELFPYCTTHSIGVIARVPFDEGSLTGKIRPETEFARDDFRNQYFGGDRKKEVWDHVQKIVSDTGTTVDQLPELALRFCLSHPAVSSVIPGMRRPEHAQANAAVSDKGPLSSQQIETLKASRWVRNYYE
ncbi:MAG: aldo/keto reductase [Terriglobales bacterium]|jgi:aryl-alcohol dehydrogenase-like predicted oxidoreductase